jgi:glycogen synthase
VKVLMLGWEFPPLISGGLGTACRGLTKGMSELGEDVLFVLPRPMPSDVASHVHFLRPRHVRKFQGREYRFQGRMEYRALNAELYPYSRPDQTAVPVAEMAMNAHLSLAGEGNVPGMGRTSSHPGPGRSERRDPYGKDLYREVARYAGLVGVIAGEEDFDVIHAHDWMTYPAGLEAAAASGKPLVVHVHSTEFDRSGENVNRWIFDIEREGMHRADGVIAVSHLTRNICIHRYDAARERVTVIYNGVEPTLPAAAENPVRRDEKIVLFLGRITMQKGPEYFVAAAKRVLEKMDDVKFIIAGTGDMQRRIIEQVARLGLGHKILFAGFLRGNEVDRAFAMADVYVMPSVSEPFGIAPLEAMMHEVPVIISRQSGVSEVLSHALKVDFWDTQELANKILGVLRHPSLRQTLGQNGGREARTLRWIDAARKCIDLYRQVTRRAS